MSLTRKRISARLSRARSELHAYQSRLADNFFSFDEGIAVLPVGAGKTAIGMTAIADLLEECVDDAEVGYGGYIGRALVVAPKKVCENVWPYEAEQWDHLKHLTVGVCTGTPKQREAVLSSTCDIVVINYDNIVWLLGERKKGKVIEGAIENHPELFDFVLFDEISRLRNWKGKWAKAVARQAHRFKIIHGMMASVAPKDRRNLFMPGRIVSRGKMFGRSFYHFLQKFFYPTDYQGWDYAAHPHLLPEMEARFNEWAWTADPSELPRTPEAQVIDRFFTLPPAARKTYKDIMNTLVAEVDGKQIVAANAAVKSGKALQIVSGFAYEAHQKIMPNGKVKKWNVVLPVHSEMHETFGEVDEELGDEPTIVGYWFEATRDWLKNAYPDMVFLDGSDDAAVIERWNAGEIARLALHPGAAGHGLNLQHGGHYMILTELWWDAELYEQLIGRIARQGQTEQPRVIRLVGRDTIAHHGCIPVVEGRLTQQDAIVAAVRRA